MRPEIVLQSDMLDILFENRNKEYGAYTLRREYNYRLMLAITGMFSVVIVFFGWFFFNNNNGSKQSGTALIIDSAMVLTQVTLPKEPPPLPAPPPPGKPQPPVATIKNVTPLIVPDNQASDPPPPVSQLDTSNAQISDHTGDGVKHQGDGAVVSGTPGGTGQEPAPPPVPEPEPDRIMEFAERMPEFPGGNQALIRFLSKYLRVPEEKLEAGQRMRVPVKFVVDRSGQLTDIQFPELADEEYKTEIRRVMKKMPKWIPGSQNGKPVAVYFSIPIIFEVTDQ